MTTVEQRYIPSKKVLGDTFDKVQNSKILIIGAGGIGCELLKNVVISGFKNIEIIDLDTIDLSNLNRQFLFQNKHIKRSKSLVARETALKFNDKVNIKAHHNNIKDGQFNVQWFKSFNVVLNALDNLDARRHVNKMCLAANVPLIESGTTGYSGNVQVIVKDKFECYDCQAKPTPKTYPVCTIRSTPSAPIHTIVWSKSYLLPQVFGEAEEDDAELDKAMSEGENANEIKTLKEEKSAFKKVREAVGEDDGPKVLFNKIFNSDVKRLLLMEDMWKNRAPPKPLDFDVALNSEEYKTVSGNSGTSIKDQRSLTLGDNVKLFIESVKRLAQRSKETNESVEFDKDNQDTLEFVTASSNLRSCVYGIPTKTIFEVKEMAGNIIPAIATTNAIIAGVQVLKMLQVLNENWQLCKPGIYLGSQLIAAPFEKPNENCTSCRDSYISVAINERKCTLQMFIDEIVRNLVSPFEGERELSVFEKERMLFDPDFDDNLSKPLADLGCQSNTFITVVDEDGQYDNVAIVLLPLDDNDRPYVLPSKNDVRQPLKRAPMPSVDLKRPNPSPSPPLSRKRNRDDSFKVDDKGVIEIDDDAAEDNLPSNAPISLDDSDDDIQIKNEGPATKKAKTDEKNKNDNNTISLDDSDEELKAKTNVHNPSTITAIAGSKAGEIAQKELDEERDNKNDN